MHIHILASLIPAQTYVNRENEFMGFTYNQKPALHMEEWRGMDDAIPAFRGKKMIKIRKKFCFIFFYLEFNI